MNSPTEDHAPNHEEEESRLRLIRQVVDILGDRLSSFVDNPLPPSDAYTAMLFERAEFLLDKAEAHLERRIHAYRLFGPNAPLISAREIEKRFQEVGWQGKAAGHVTIRKLILNLLSHAEVEVQRQQDLLTGILSVNAGGQSFSDKLEAGVAQLIDRLSLGNIVTDVFALREAITTHIGKLLDEHLRQGRSQYHREDPSAPVSVSRFLKFVCNSRSLEEFKTKGEGQLVRPYELFLFASQSGLMEDSLTSWLSRISEANLSPLYKSSISIMEAYGAPGSDGDHGL